MAPEQSQSAPQRRKASRWSLWAALVLGAGVIVMALLTVRQLVTGGGRAPVWPGAGRAGPRPRPAPATAPHAATNPAGLIANPLAGTGMTKLEKAPRDAFAPSGAVMLWAFRRAGPDGDEVVVAYRAPGALEDAERFYLERLAAAGYKQLDRRPKGPAGVRMVFIRGAKPYEVSLRKSDREERAVVIGLVIGPETPP